MPYILIEHIGSESIAMLSLTWEKYQNDCQRRERLLHSLARITLSISRIPQPCIGSFRFHDDCTISLSNRYLTSTIAVFENEGSKQAIPSNRTYSCTDAFVSDLITIYLECFLGVPNSCPRTEDGFEQLTMISILRIIVHCYMKPELCHGLYLLSFTDLTCNNIFVDDDWNIWYLVDLEWLCLVLAEMYRELLWLFGQSTQLLIDDENCR